MKLPMFLLIQLMRSIMHHSPMLSPIAANSTIDDFMVISTPR